MGRGRSCGSLLRRNLKPPIGAQAEGVLFITEGKAMTMNRVSRRNLLKSTLAAPILVSAPAKAAISPDAEIVELGVATVLERIRKGEMTTASYVQTLLRQLERHKNLNTVITIDPSRVLDEASAVDKARAGGAKLGPLAGLPMVVKDHTDVAGYPTTAAVPRAALNNRVARISAPVVQKLQDNGVIIFAKANYAGGATGTNRWFGPSRNPYDLRRISGGSSGGSAAAMTEGGAIGATDAAHVAVATGSAGEVAAQRDRELAMYRQGKHLAVTYASKNRGMATYSSVYPLLLSAGFPSTRSGEMGAGVATLVDLSAAVKRHVQTVELPFLADAENPSP